MQNNTNTNLSTMSLQQVIKTFGQDKPWKQTGENPMRWASNFVARKLNEQGEVLEQPTTGFADNTPTLTHNPEDSIIEALDTCKAKTEVIYEETGKDLTEMFTQARKAFNPSIVEVVVHKEDKVAQVVEIHNLIQQGRKNLNWVAKLQLTEPTTILRSDDGMEEIYDTQMETKRQFEQAYDDKMTEICTVIVETFTAMGKAYNKAQKKAKQKAHQEKLAQQKKEEREAKAAAQERARKHNTPQGRMEQEFSKARQALLAKMHRALNYRQDHVKRIALAEYKRLTEVCQLSVAQAVQQIMVRFN